MLGGGEPREIRAVSVSDGLFELMGLRTVAGRGFTREEHQPGRNNAAVLDHGFWHRTFGGDAGALGRLITIGGARYTIVGVLAEGGRLPADVPGARVPSEADVYLPIAYDGAFSATATAQRRSNSLAVLARSRATATPAIIDEDLRRIARELQAVFPQTNADLTMNAISVRDLLVGDVRRPLLVLLGAVGFVLLIACANVASLIVARASARQDELAVRTALGARRGRLVRQLLTEAVVLGVAGGALGLALAYAATKALVAADPADIPRLAEIELDWTVVLFTLVVSLLASFVLGALPALQATRRFGPGLRGGRRGGTADRNAQRLRSGLIVTEVALAVVLLAGAGLLLRSLIALTHVAPGFAVEQAMSFRIALFGRGYDQNAVRARVADFERALQALPGITAVATTSVLPLSGPGPRLAFSVTGVPPPAGVNPEIGVVSVSPDYRRAIGATLVTGRDFTEPRWRQRAAGRDHQRGSGSPLVPRREAGREAGADERHPGDRGRRCRRAPGRPETAGGTSTLRSACAASNAHDLAHRPHGRTASSAGAVGPRRDSPIRRESGRVGSDGAQSAPHRRDRAPAILHGAPGAVRGARAGTRRDRHLWCHELYRRRAHSRNRHPHGPWCALGECRSHDRGQGRGARAHGRCHRCCRRSRHRPGYPSTSCLVSRSSIH